MDNLTPAMKQYMAVKTKHPDCIVMFRMGDFYEMFYEDAKTAARELNITLTSRGKGEKKAPLAGIPYHAIEPYITKLIKKGYKLAICEQLEDPKFAKGVVKRDVTRIMTPGTVMESNILNERTNNYIMSLTKENNQYGIALADISTGEFIVSNISLFTKLMDEVTRFAPIEIVMPLSLEKSGLSSDLIASGLFISPYDDRHFWEMKAKDTLLEHFKVANLDGYGCTGLSINAAGALLSYLKDTQKITLPHINRIKVFHNEEFMMLDQNTIRNLELLRNIKENTGAGTFISAIDRTITAIGSRLLRKWVLRPLRSIEQITERLDTVDELSMNRLVAAEIHEILPKMYDIERIIGRINFGNANARDLVAMKSSLKVLPELKDVTRKSDAKLIRKIDSLSGMEVIVDVIEARIKEEPALGINEGGIIREGYNAELDRMHNASRNAKKLIAEIENNERNRTGIKSLKIKYNRIFGYFIEVTKPNLSLVPVNYIKRQTQVNSERFVTEELKELESMILSSQEKSIALEYELFKEVIEKIKEKTAEIQEIANYIGQLDCLNSFALSSLEHNYCRPVIDNSNVIDIKNGRHAVVEHIEPEFIPNDVHLDSENRLMIITGPNLSGKSTVMRQTALIVLMAQIGSYVPAESARIGIVDRIFTRIGAHDDITKGQSTFMVEMNETANIINNATDKSLIILDEIGRGTSTFDGISIAWAVAEYINNNIRAKTMFATHYHQMNYLAKKHAGIKNYNIAVKEDADRIILLRKLVEGGTDKSYGVYVAKLAGMPLEIIERAKAIMEKLEAEDKIVTRLKYNEDKQKTLFDII